MTPGENGPSKVPGASPLMTYLPLSPVAASPGPPGPDTGTAPTQIPGSAAGVAPPSTLPAIEPILGSGMRTPVVAVVPETVSAFLITKPWPRPGYQQAARS